MKNLREYRLSLNLTQADFGERLGVSAQQIYNWESGFRQMSGSSIIQLCEVFGVDVQINKDGVFILDNTEMKKIEKQFDESEFINLLVPKSEKDVRREAKQEKAEMPSLFYASYELPSGSWQALMAFDSKREAEQVVSFHARDRRYFII